MLVVLILHILVYTTMQPEQLNSFLTVSPDSEFPLENIPFGAVFSKQQPAQKYLATRIGTFFIM